MQQTRIMRRRTSTRGTAADIEQAFPVPAADLAIDADDIATALAGIDAALESTRH
jgi:hypothetical protein